MLVSLEGLPGAGKSTLLSKLSDVTPKFDYILLPEPLHHLDFLEVSMLNPKENLNFHLQMDFLANRTKLYLPYRDDILDPQKIVLCERTEASERYVFARYLRDTGRISINEFVLLDKLYQLMELSYSELMVPDKVIYFDIDARTARDRVIKRNRTGEVGYWKLNELEKLLNAYTAYVKGLNDVGIPILIWNQQSTIESLVHFVSDTSNGLDNDVSRMCSLLDITFNDKYSDEGSQ